MADEQGGKTGRDALAEQYFKLGFELVFEEDKIKKNVDPVLAALQKKLEGLSKASKIETGIFGKDFAREKIKQLTGIDTQLYTGIKNIISYGAASKAGAVDNGEFYNSLNFMGKGLINLADKFKKKKAAEKEAAEQTKKTQSDMVSLDDAVGKLEGLQKATKTGDVLASNLESLGPATEAVAGGLTKVIGGAEGATTAMEIFGSVASAGIALVAIAVIKLAEYLYQMFMQAVAARAEFKNFDRLWGGIGKSGVSEGVQTLGKLNTKLWGLGQSLGTINGVVLDFVKNGMGFKQSIDENLVSGVVMLAGALGAANSAITKLYSSLLKTTNIKVSSLIEAGNSLVAYNRAAYKLGLSKVSFEEFAESITSSANALGIAANKGEAFTNRMIKDLTTLTGLAQRLEIGIGSLNEKFEEAGSLISNQDDKFRNLLILSGGANFNELITNQFDKTEAMLKAISYAKDLNNSFGNNIQLTAQIMQQQMGVSKAEAIKMINMKQDTIADIRKAAQDIAGLQTDATRDAFEKVNSDISSVWDRIKTMFTTFFQNAFGSSGGMQELVKRVEGFLEKLRGYMDEQSKEGGWISKLRTIIDKIADWLGNNLAKLIDWIGDKLDQFSKPDAANPFVQMFDTVIGMLTDAAWGIGLKIGLAMVVAMNPVLWLPAILFFVIKKLAGWIGDLFSGSTPSNSKNEMLQQVNNPLNQQLEAKNSRINDIKSQQSNLEKYQPDQITYGVNANGETGYMTVAQKQFLLEKEKERLEAEREETQKEIKENTKKSADALERMVNEKNPSKTNAAGRIRSDSPFDPENNPAVSMGA